MMMKMILAAAAVLAMTGCASVVNDVTAGMRIDTKTAAGETITGAECTLTNDYGTTSAKSGRTEAVRRSSKDLDITCSHKGQPDAKGTAISRANAGLAGNIIIGGVIGAVVDHSRGTAYTYPTWIEMIFGQTLVFDRMGEKEGTPLKGEPAGAKAAGAATAPTASANSNSCMYQLSGANCAPQK
jgi:hypothetical protein